MRNAPTRFLVVFAAVALLRGTGMASAGDPDGQQFDEIERGRYLATAADCFACHTVPNVGKPFAGGRSIETPFGNIVAPNITPDLKTGIGSWSDQQFDAAVREGIRPDGSRLYPAMPFTSYTKMSHDDVLAIRAYLNTVEPVHQSVKANTLPFPFNIRAAMRAWDALYFTPGEFVPDSHQSVAWNRGAYLVLGPGHCAACHTPKNFAGGNKGSDSFRGGRVQGWFAPDISADANQGLGRWSEADVVNYLKSGHNQLTAATGPMAEEITDSTSRLSNGDLAAMATYLKSLSGRQDDKTSARPSPSIMTAGQAIYRDQCSACHGIDGAGIPMLFPSLVKSSLAHASDPIDAIRLVLRGGRSVATRLEPTAEGMPAFAWQLDDQQVAAVLSYVRNAWTTSSPPVSTEIVKQARDQLKDRRD